MEKQKLYEEAVKIEKAELTDEQADSASGGRKGGLGCRACGKPFDGAGIKTPYGTMCPKCAPNYMITIV